MFANVDWSKTRAYAIGLNGIYLNLRGREKNGILNPGPEAAETVNEIRRRLLALRDPVNGNAVASAVYRRRTSTAERRLHRPRIWLWDGRQDTAPRGKARSASISSEMIEDNYDEWRADHCIAADLVPGVLFSNRAVRLPDPRLEDLTTTLLAEFGTRPEPGMKGRTIF